MDLVGILEDSRCFSDSFEPSAAIVTKQYSKRQMWFSYPLCHERIFDVIRLLCLRPFVNCRADILQQTVPKLSLWLGILRIICLLHFWQHPFLGSRQYDIWIFCASFSKSLGVLGYQLGFLGLAGQIIRLGWATSAQILTNSRNVRCFPKAWCLTLRWSCVSRDFRLHPRLQPF